VKQGIVYFVGAGPGHPGLITLHGVECLRRADVVLYDYLANSRTLSHARAGAELICLGRHGRADIWSQPSINEELVRRATAGECVVRLKGGDPMIFGRAAEEISAVAAAEIPFEVVPGVTAATAAGAFAGVTVTDREHASAVALVTGHEQLGKPESLLDYQSLATFPGTLVIYMGVQTGPSWSQALVEAGKPADTPVLVVRRVSRPDQMTFQTTLSDLVSKLQETKVRPPVVFFVGEAARRKPGFDWFSRLPLLNTRIVVTRPRQQAEQMVSRLSELGANAMLQPAISISDPSDWKPVDDAIQQLSSFDYLVFSSANGVHYFLRRLLSLGADVRRLANAKLAVIGPRTGDALGEYHLRADVQPVLYRAEALADALVSDAKGKRLLLLRASRGREVLAERLSEAGGIVQQVVAYQSDDVRVLDTEVQR